jgi:hypothetical protein
MVIDNQFFSGVQSQLEPKLSAMGLNEEQIFLVMQLAKKAVTLQLANGSAAKHMLSAVKNPYIEDNVLTLRNMEAHYAFELVDGLDLEFSACCKIAELVMPFTIWQLIGQMDQSPYQFDEHIERQSAVINGIG